MKHVISAMACILLPGLASADGFAAPDLTRLSVDVTGYRGGTFVAIQNDPDRLTIACTDCSGLTAIDILIGRQTDGTEDRIRSGQTRAEDMRALCLARDPTCELDLTSLGRAVGWVTAYAGVTTGSTTILLLDGDILTIRSIASDVDTAQTQRGPCHDHAGPCHHWREMTRPARRDIPK